MTTSPHGAGPISTGTRPLLGDAERALLRADADSERLAAVVRVAIFVAVAWSVYAAQASGFDHRPLVAATVVYGVGTLAGLVLAACKVYRPWLPYAFVALDVVTLALALLLLGRMLDLPTSEAAALPVGGLVIVVLLHASMHHRWTLVGFGAALFVTSLIVGGLLIDGIVSRTSPGDPGNAHDHLAHFRYFPAAIFVLTCAILLITTRRTRRFIDEAFTHASRATDLSRYFAPEVVEELARRSGGAASYGERMNVAVLFADLRGFTAMAETMDPAELAAFLSDFRSRLAKPAVDHGGIVDKYIGDAIMVVFGVPQSGPDDANRALRCAVAMAEAMRSWSILREQRGLTSVRIGVGGHYGSAFAGVLSDGRLLEYTVIGDTVNVASRLADLPGLLPTNVAVSADLLAAAGGLPAPECWSSAVVESLPGRPRPIGVHRWKGS